ncbi:MAG: hypothetical protein WCG84_01015 [Candidatus Moraniibacteriota bacterium]
MKKKKGTKRNKFHAHYKIAIKWVKNLFIVNLGKKGSHEKLKELLLRKISRSDIKTIQTVQAHQLHTREHI